MSDRIPIRQQGPFSLWGAVETERRVEREARTVPLWPLRDEGPSVEALVASKHYRECHAGRLGKRHEDCERCRVKCPHCKADQIEAWTARAPALDRDATAFMRQHRKVPRCPPWDVEPTWWQHWMFCHFDPR